MDGINQKMRTGMIFSQLKPKFCQNYRIRFFNQCLSRPFCTCNCYLIVQYCVWFLGMETWYRWIARKSILIWAVLTNRPDSSPNDLLGLCYRVFSQQISICRILFNQNVTGKCHCFSHFLDRCCQKLGVVWFFLETNLPFSKTSACISFIKVSVDYFVTCKNIGEFYFLRLVPLNAILICGICQKMHIRMICLITFTSIQSNRLKFPFSRS